MKKTLTELANIYNADKNEEGHNYMPMYEFWLGNRKVDSLIEIGFGPGASPRMWRDYFPRAQIYVLENFGKEFMETWGAPDTNIQGVSVVKGDATKPEIWNRIHNDIDVIIDDASHIPTDQIKMFELGFPKLRSHGLYFIEDVYTNFDAGYSNEDVIYPWLNALIANMQNPGVKRNAARDFYHNNEFMTYPSSAIYSYHIYRNVLLFEKA